MSYRRIPTDEQWASQRLQGFPARWRDQIDQQWRERHAARNIDARRTANLFLFDITSRLNALKLPLNADDATIREAAARKAAECLGLAPAYTGKKARRAALERVVRQFNCEPPMPMRITRNGAIAGVMDQPAILRMTCAKWWRKAIRVMHRKFFEAAAMQLGFINAKMGSYVSDESLKRRVQQRKRTQRLLERTLATNEEGACFSLADLKERSVSNPAIKRGELMTRINGCEAIARELGHIGLFLTVTCPSRMHKFTKGKRSVRSNGRWYVRNVRENPRYDGTLPNEAQSYLSSMFARLRAFLGNHGVKWYGFRIAEPNHDGTPHWHFLVFFDPALFRRRKGVRAPGQRGRVKDVFVRDERAALLPRLCAWIRRYALEDSPDERGAKHHRVDFRPIDWKRGTAAGYIAKYVAKNIDGYGVQDDMFGNAGLETAMRVDAWASTWGIRQFQPIGGPPVTVWREARRIDKVPDGAPCVLDEMYAAVNKFQYSDGEVESASWAKYVKSNGGMFCPRNDRPVQIYREYDERLGQYGEPVGDCVKGLEARGIRYEQDGIVLREKFVSMVVRTNRHTWTIVPRVPSDAEIDLTRNSSRMSWELGLGLAREACPWTRVNNCTQSQTPDSSDFDDWIADYDRADNGEPAGRGAATTNSWRTADVPDRHARSDLHARPVARAVEEIHVSSDDIGDLLADYALAEARGRPSICTREKRWEAS
ncbi:replication endonuclease [Caballeronia sp. LZ001]|uniref:replication endonuclease n=1 Tax=Caballeronia sp. LZ001 TaxID=3038553 RepID=UPI002856C181|nr:replication endonuclease [Caballeronia sp. LZ001]MDR5805263.1 replication endonuclease [Caballeronia sp. LZ001]